MTKVSSSDQQTATAADFSRREDARRDAAQDDDDHQQSRQRRDERHSIACQPCHSGGRIATLDRHEIRRHQHADRQEQRRDDARQHQAGDRHLAARGEGVDDHVVAGRHQRAHQRRMGRDVDGVVGVVALLLHHGDHDAAHRRHVGDRRAGHSPEQRAGDHVRHAQPAAHVADGAFREIDDLLRDAAVKHQFAGEDEERDGQEREDVHPRNHPLEHHRDRDALERDGRDAGQADGESDRDAQDQEQSEAAGQDHQCHDGSTSLFRRVAMICSVENRQISTPASTTGMY